MALVVAAVAVVLVTAGRRQADDPRSPTTQGAGALGQLLSDDGVTITTTASVPDALSQIDEQTTLVVAAPDQLSADEATQLLRRAPNRVLLLRPNSAALLRFTVQAEGVAPASGALAPECDAPPATQAGSVSFNDMRASYRPTAPQEISCYPTGAGFGYLRAGTASGQQIDLLAGGLANDQLADPGNAALAMNLLGARPRLVWLMAEPSSTGSGAAVPTLLPGWWELAAVQAGIGLVAVGIWRGRRLGPIIPEPLPVRVRASETVEGHGRLYHRLSSRGQAAESLRTGTRERLGSVFGHSGDPLALSGAVATRTGRPVEDVRTLLFGPDPADDDQLMNLIARLDQLEQEARQP